MTDIQLYTQITMLPNNLKNEVSDFVEILKSKTKKATTIKERKFGYAKGYFKMSVDFDAPLDNL